MTRPVLIVLSLFSFLILPVRADSPISQDDLFSKAFELINIITESENGIFIRAEIRVLGLQNGESKAIYARAWTPDGRRRSELAAPGYQEASITVGSKAWTYQSSRPTPLRVMQINDALSPLLSLESMRLTGSKPKTSSEKVSGMRLTCIESKGWRSQKRCFDSTTGYLLLADDEYWETLYSDYEAFGAKSFPRTFKVYQGKQLILEGKISLEKSATPIAASQFVAPPKFEPATELPTCPAGVPKTVKAGVLQSYVRPIYPVEAKNRRQSGKVVFFARIAKDGSVKDLVVVKSAGDSLDGAAWSAVSKRRYTPHVYCGQPIEVDTYITVDFTISG